MNSSDASLLPHPHSMPAIPATPCLPRRSRFAFLRETSTYLLLVLLLALGALGYQFFASLHVVTITIDDQHVTLLTRQTTVRGALAEAGIALNEADVSIPAGDALIPESGQIIIRPAQSVVLDVDGDSISRRTQSQTVAAFLKENSITVKPSDHVLLDGRIVDLVTPLPRFATQINHSAIPSNVNPLTHITVQRAVPLTLDDNGALSTIFTTEPTLGQALRAAGVLVYLGDYVAPDLGEPTATGRTVSIRRSQPATIVADGRAIYTRTRAGTVVGLLAQEGIQLTDKDFAQPPLTATVQANMSVAVTRVREDFKEIAEPIKFETQYQPDPDIEIDSQLVVQTGIDGVKKTLIKSVFYNGILQGQGVEREWIDSPKQDKIIHYGTKIVERPITLPDGTVTTYWRKVRMLATSYTAATSGKSRGNPLYGITFSGLHAGKGIVAVDPHIVRLGSDVYVPGYGMAVAGDTGGAINGRHIDLGYDEGDLVLWFDFVDVYLLSPIPPLNTINYRLPALPASRYSFLH